MPCQNTNLSPIVIESPQLATLFQNYQQKFNLDSDARRLWRESERLPLNHIIIKRTLIAKIRHIRLHLLLALFFQLHTVQNLGISSSHLPRTIPFTETFISSQMPTLLIMPLQLLHSSQLHGNVLLAQDTEETMSIFQRIFRPSGENFC